MKKIALLLTVFLLPSVSYAVDGNELLSNCSKAIKVSDGAEILSSDYFGVGTCMGTIRGIIDAGNIINTSATQRCYSKQDVYCVPVEVSTVQATRVVVKYLKDHPEDLHQRDTRLIVTALTEAFPCKGK
ncbi:MAG: Rap1a/Tai family immunity protein [Gammaproteobacteria bacterium]|nr:Rap1a/Tai family immunity protein [Gammaproteobacteria bacterium]